MNKTIYLNEGETTFVDSKEPGHIRRLVQADMEHERVPNHIILEEVLKDPTVKAKKTTPQLPKTSGKTINPDNQCKCGQMKIAGKCPKCKK